MKQSLTLKVVAALVALLLSTPTLLYASSLPRAEYPRPQFDRSQSWVNLNGAWSFTIDHGGSGHEREFFNSKGFEQTIIVPFAPESVLSGVNYRDFISDMWYQRTISIPADWRGQNVMLNFGAVYYMAEIFVDGKFVDRHFGGTSSFAVDVTKFVEAGKEHNLVVYVNNNIRGGQQTAGKQNLRYESWSCMYTRTTGIWQTVWMEAVNAKGLKNTFVRTDIDASQVVVQPTFYSESAAKLNVTVKDHNGKTIARQSAPASNSAVVVLPIKNAYHWSPESPYLYDMTYEVIDSDGKVLDKVESYFGMRKVHIEGNKVYLNNKPYYQRLVLDQVFYEDGIWTAPSDAALKADIELGLAAGFNGARLHQKVFEERFYYWADKLGYLTWGEASSWGMDANDPVTARNFISEWTECVIRDRNHPSLIVWTPHNEAWWPDRVQYPRFLTDLYNITKAIDPTRPFHDASGGVHVKTDIYTVHNYEQDPAKLKELILEDGKMFQGHMMEPKGQNSRNLGFNTPRFNDHYEFLAFEHQMPYLIDEFGGIKWNPAQVDNSDQSWGYGQAPRSLNEFYARLEGQIDALMSISDKVWGYCYTQLTDVELEQNGVYYYGRGLKFDMNKIKAQFSKNPAQEPQQTNPATKK